MLRLQRLANLDLRGIYVRSLDKDLVLAVVSPKLPFMARSIERVTVSSAMDSGVAMAINEAMVSLVRRW